MPLNKSRSKAAFQQNVKTEIAAGRPPKQAVAIAYSVKGEHHSDHSRARSEHYHRSIVATQIGRGANRMTRGEQQISNLEEAGESDSKS